MFKDKTLLITGGTGSFGNAVLKRFLNTDIGEIRIFSRDEKKQDDMRRRLKSEKVKFYIGDVRDRNSVDSAVRGTDYVFHAAALKQVPSCEFYPLEAVNTNILGAENVMNSAIDNQVKKIVVLSTDKAVYPINAMGLSKALMEKIMVAKSRTIVDNQTVMCGTRYGNVMASRGSVIPLFVQQIKEKAPLTVTDPNMTRFLMSLDSAVELVLFAYNKAKQGDIIVQKAPASTIHDLAVAIRELFNADNKINIIGTRHGEKKHETLVHREDMVKAQDLGGYFRIPADNRDLNYTKYFEEGEVEVTKQEDYTSENTRRLTIPEIKQLVSELDYIQDELSGKNGELYA